MDFNTDRPRGILSPADRELLLGEVDMDHEQSRRNAEARVRQRVVDSIKDFDLLVHALKSKDRQQIFTKSVDDPEFIDGLTMMLSFAYLGMKESGIEFSHVLEPAIRRTEEAHAANTLGSMVDVAVEFNVDTQLRTEIDDVRTRLVATDPITPAELFSFLVAKGDAPANVDTIVVRHADAEQPADEFVANIADFLDADIEDHALNQIRLSL
jgi:hypothetical protein